MNIAFDITHPADVHQFKNCIKTLQQHGYNILITARNANEIKELLRQNEINFITRKSGTGLINRIKNMIPIINNLYYIYKSFHPYLLIGASGNLYISHVARLLGKTSIIFDDTEHTHIQNLLTFPFAHYICTPACYLLDIGDKQVRYCGSKELAYLHPNNYRYNESWEFLKKFHHDKKTILLRLAAWNASHDLFRNGPFNWRVMVPELEKLATLVIVPGYNGYADISRTNTHLPINKFHDLISFADVVISEGATTAAEAAVLGKPTIYCNDLRLGYIDEYDHKYGLIKQIKNEKELLCQVKRFLADENISHEFNLKHQQLLHDKIDVNQWMLDFISGFNPSANQRKKSKRRIFFVSNFDPRYTRAGGTETYVKEIANSLIEKNYQINIVGVSEINKNRRENSRPAFQEKLYLTNRMKFSQFIPIYYNKNITFSTSIEFLMRLLVKSPFLRFKKTDILHIQRPDYALPFIFRNNPKICSFHGNPREVINHRKNHWISKLYNLIERITLPFMDKLVFVDHCTMSKYQQQYPKLVHKMTIIPPAVGNQFFPFSKHEIENLKTNYGFKKNETILLVVGRLEKEKNIGEIIEIFNSLSIHQTQHSYVRLLIVGDGRLYNDIRNKIENESNGNITLHNHVDHEKLPQIFNLADITILFSQTEGMPLVVLESLACGTPVVASRVGDLSRLIKDGFNGYLVDKTIVHEKLNLLIENPPDWIKNCVHSINSYRNEKFIQKIKRLYEEDI